MSSEKENSNRVAIYLVVMIIVAMICYSTMYLIIM